jgi:hypothetical protein
MVEGSNNSSATFTYHVILCGAPGIQSHTIQFVLLLRRTNLPFDEENGGSCG